MTESHKEQLQTQLWNISNKLCGEMNADEFTDYVPVLGPYRKCAPKYYHEELGIKPLF